MGITKYGEHDSRQNVFDNLNIFMEIQ